MKLVIDENIPLARELFGQFGDIELVAGRSIGRAQAANADALLVRSVTRVDADLLEGSGVGFVGTATIGVDHIDFDYLKSRNIAFSSAPGCNAQAVVDYVLSALAQLALRHDFDLRQKCVGIVGLGHVGSALQQRLQAFGVRCIASDPPLARLASSPQAKELVSLPQLLEQADIVSLHTPYTREGEDATHHLLNPDTLAQLRPNAILINTGRGAVVSATALASVLPRRPDLKLVLDVWENEPQIDLGLLPYIALATPHIAGYSQEGKVRGTLQIYRAFCQHFGVEAAGRTDDLLPSRQVCCLSEELSSGSLAWCHALLAGYDIGADDRALRDVMTGVTAGVMTEAIAAQATSAKDVTAQRFDQLRKQYVTRLELGSLLLRLPQKEVQVDLKADLSALGFSDCVAGV